MRSALACVVGVHPNDITWIAPRRGGRGRFWEEYEAEAKRLGYVMTIRCLKGNAQRWKNIEPPAGLWIAQVPGNGGRSTHAIVLDGDRPYFDNSGRPRKRHPNRVLRIVVLEPDVLSSIPASHNQQGKGNMADQTDTKEKVSAKPKPAKPKAKSKTSKGKPSKRAKAKTSTSKRSQYTEAELAIREHARGLAVEGGKPFAAPITSAEAHRVVAALGGKSPFDDSGPLAGLSEEDATKCAKTGGREVSTRSVGDWKRSHPELETSSNRRIVALAVAASKVS
jgi:hypothetical protein